MQRAVRFAALDSQWGEFAGRGSAELRIPEADILQCPFGFRGLGGFFGVDDGGEVGGESERLVERFGGDFGRRAVFEAGGCDRCCAVRGGRFA